MIGIDIAFGIGILVYRPCDFIFEIDAAASDGGM
jgi:hypothetical protein